MTTKFSQDVISLSDLKVNLGEVVKHVTDSRRPDHPSCHPDHPTCHPDHPTCHPDRSGGISSSWQKTLY